MNKFEFGQKVRITHKFVRTTRFIGKRGGNDILVRWRVWSVNSFNKVGLYIGQRTLADGIIEDGDYDEGRFFVPKKYIEAALVVYSLNENPVYVPLDSIFEYEESKNL